MAACGCCGDAAKQLGFGNEWWCKEHYVFCLHTPDLGLDGTKDLDDDDPEYLEYVALLEAEWEAAR